MRYHMLTSELIQLAGRKARSHGHSYVGSGHLLLAMAAQPGEAGQLLRSAGICPELTETILQLQYGMGTPNLPLPQGLSREAKEILRGAAAEARKQNSREILPIHVLLSLSRSDTSSAGQLLRISGITAQDLFSQTVEYIQWEQKAITKLKKEAVSTKLLDQFSEDLVAKAATMDPVIGRDREIDMVIGILCRKTRIIPRW